MIIADENIPLPIIKALQINGIETLSIFEQFRGISDVEIVKLAQNPPKIIITEDKDFGDLVFAYNQTQVSDVLLRYHYTELEILTSILLKFLQNHTIDPFSFVVISTKNIRIRKL